MNEDVRLAKNERIRIKAKLLESATKQCALL